MTIVADREQIAHAIKALESYSEALSHRGAREALVTIKLTLPGVTLTTLANYMAIWEDKIEPNGRVVWRGEYDLTEFEYAVAMELRPEWQPTAQEFFQAVILLYRNKHPERTPNNG